ncbi:DNA repair protein RadC [archaeon AH-315-M20]|nr:DNA repair protein RadC [archaeon AH-315-M20]
MKDIPWWNRPGYKLKKGNKPDPAELLAIILEKGIRLNESSVELANKLLSKYKSLAGLADVSISELEKEVGRVKALKLKSMFELFNITNRAKRKGFKPTIECAQDVYNYFVDELKNKKKEHFYILMLDSKNRIIKEELVSVGTLNTSLVHPREVFKEAIKTSANAIILVHNHPSGNPEPSGEDEIITQKLIDAGNIINIKFLDHIVITSDKFVSIIERIRD